MLARLKAMFAGGPASTGAVCRRRVDLLQRFTILLDTSDKGSMSRVYKAIDRETGHVICLKIQDRAKNDSAMKRASHKAPRPAEGEIAVRINHPQVVRTFEYGDTSRGEHYLVMEFVDGWSFHHLCETKQGRTAQKLEWLAQAAEGLAAVHAAGFIHHDINPGNFLLSREHQVKLIDFGLAVPNKPAFRGPGNRTGTLRYMAPELIRRESIDERIDIFSFGVVAFELLTDRLPYPCNRDSTITMLQRLTTPPLDPATAKPKLSVEVCDLLLKLIARRRDERWPAMAGLAETLRSIPPKRP
jgi:serine/threonine-protein kinase